MLFSGGKGLFSAMSPAFALSQHPDFLKFLSPLAMMLSKKGGGMSPLGMISPAAGLLGLFH